MAGLYDFKVAEKLGNVPFDALIMAAAMKADNKNLQRLRRAFPDLVRETRNRFDAPGGQLEGE